MEIKINPLLVQQSREASCISGGKSCGRFQKLECFKKKKKEKREFSEILGSPGFEEGLKSRGTEFLVLYKDMQKGGMKDETQPYGKPLKNPIQSPFKLLCGHKPKSILPTARRSQSRSNLNTDADRIQSKNS